MRGLVGESVFLQGGFKHAAKATACNLGGSLVRGSISEGPRWGGCVSARGV